MTLREKQTKFVKAIAQFIIWASENDFELTFGEAYRSDEQAVINNLGHSRRQEAAATLRAKPVFFKLAEVIANNPKTGQGIINSLHTVRLAVDFNVFLKGGILAQAGEITPLGEYWESIGGTWGGRFGDPSHFSFAHNGVK